MKHLVAPSLLSADFGNLNKDIEMLNQSEADWLHLDIMDGTFVPNISFGFPVLKAISKLATKSLDVHLMIHDPDRYIKAFRDAGAYLITVHYEACTHLHRTLQFIRSTGALSGVALNPHTPVALLEDVVAEADLILIMSVNPGFGGQKFIPQAMEKIRRTREMIDKINPKTLLEVDGGIDLTNSPDLIHAGANVLVAGNGIFSTRDPLKTISEMKAL